MFQQLAKTLLPFPVFGFHLADEGGGGSGGEGSSNAGGDASAKQGVSKADFERVSKENEALKQSVEDLRLEIMTPEYLEFLKSKDESEGKPKEEVKSSEEDLSKLSPQQIWEKAKEAARKEASDEVKKLREEITSKSKADTQKEVAAFAQTHTDYEQFRPVMYGLSLDPKYKDASLQVLYDASKEHIKNLRTGLTQEEKERNRKFSGEKPGGASGSFDSNKKYSPEEAAEESWKETVGGEGLPSA